MKPNLTDSQIRLIRYAARNPYSILAGGTGTGKTRVAIELSEAFNLPTLIICPSYQVTNWVDEIRKWETRDSKILAIKKGKEIRDPSGYDFAIISYKLAQKAEHWFEWAKMIFIDEAHNIKSMKAKQTEFIHRVVFENSINRVHPMTGTILKNRVEEYYANIALTEYNPRVKKSEFLERFPDSIEFADHFSYRSEFDMEINNRFITVVKWEGIKNVPELKKWLQGKYLRVDGDKRDTPIYIPIKISNTPDKALLMEFRKQFQDLSHMSKKEKEDYSYKELREMNTASAVPEHKAMAAKKKVPFTISYTQNLLEEVDTCIIYSDHKESSEELAQAFNTVALNSNVNPHKRMEYARKFQAGEGRVLVITRAMSEGITLTRSSDMVENDYPWVPGDLKQIEARIDRMGQKKTCRFHRIFGSPQDEYIFKAIQAKQEVIDIAT